MKVFKKGFGFIEQEEIAPTKIEVNDVTKTKPKRKSSANVKRVSVKRTSK
jgi:hypothetical protein